MAVLRLDSATELRLSIDGSAQVGEAEALSGSFREALEASPPSVVLDLGGLTRVDLCFFQLMLALGRSLASQGRNLVIRPLPPDHLVREEAALLGIDFKRLGAGGDTKQ